MSYGIKGNQRVTPFSELYKNVGFYLEVFLGRYKLVSPRDFQQSHLCNRRLGQGVKPFVKPFDITRKRFFLEVRSGGNVSILSPRPPR